MWRFAGNGFAVAALTPSEVRWNLVLKDGVMGDVVVWVHSLLDRRGCGLCP